MNEKHRNPKGGRLSQEPIEPVRNVPELCVALVDHGDGGYINDVLALVRSAGPGWHHVKVKHGAACPMLNGGTVCNCGPEVEMGDFDVRVH
jgi:hypothetical protein